MNKTNVPENTESIAKWENQTILETLTLIERSNIGAVLFTDKKGKPAGFVTDGDIRRSLIAGKNLTDDVSQVWNSNPLIAQDSTPMSERYQMLMERTLKHIIIVDQNGENAKLQSLEKLKALYDVNPRRCPVLLMAGGRGIRLMPLTENCPKPMIELNGKPLLHLTLENLIERGFERFFISVHYLKEQIKDYFGDGSKFNVSISYVEEDKPRGTAGCLKLLPEITDGNLIIMNGDIVTDMDFRSLLSFHDAQKSAATMVVKEVSSSVPYGLVRTDGNNFLSLSEKPEQNHLINTGIYAVHHTSLSDLPNNDFFTMPNLFDRLTKRGKGCSVFELKGRWIDIGDKQQLANAQAELAKEAKSLTGQFL